MGILKIAWRTENGRLTSWWLDAKVQQPGPSGLGQCGDRTAREREGNRELCLTRTGDDSRPNRVAKQIGRGDVIRSQIRKALLVANFAALAAIASTGVARADPITIIFSNYGPAGSFNTVAGNALGFFAFQGNLSNEAVAMPFTASQTADLTLAILPLQLISGANFPVSVFLESDNNGTPGTILASLTQQFDVTFIAGNDSFAYTGAPVKVSAGVSYWLVAAQPNAFVGQTLNGWFGPPSPVNGTIDFNATGSPTGPWSNESGIISAFQLDGTPVTTTPEPGTFGLLASSVLFGAGVFWAERRRRSRQARA
jgi:hypothetical protein